MGGAAGCWEEGPVTRAMDAPRASDENREGARGRDTCTEAPRDRGAWPPTPHSAAVGTTAPGSETMVADGTPAIDTGPPTPLCTERSPMEVPVSVPEGSPVTRSAGVSQPSPPTCHPPSEGAGHPCASVAHPCPEGSNQSSLVSTSVPKGGGGGGGGGRASEKPTVAEADAGADAQPATSPSEEGAARVPTTTEGPAAWTPPSSLLMSAEAASGWGLGLETSTP